MATLNVIQHQFYTLELSIRVDTNLQWTILKQVKKKYAYQRIEAIDLDSRQYCNFNKNEPNGCNNSNISCFFNCKRYVYETGIWQ